MGMNATFKTHIKIIYFYPNTIFLAFLYFKNSPTIYFDRVDSHAASKFKQNLSTSEKSVVIFPC